MKTMGFEMWALPVKIVQKMLLNYITNNNCIIDIDAFIFQDRNNIIVFKNIFISVGWYIIRL